MKKSFRAIRIKSQDEFNWLIEHLTHESFRVRDHWEIWAAFEEAVDDYAAELNHTANFWELTRRAHQDAVVLRLARLFDPDASAISLGNFLETVRAHAIAQSTLLPSAVANLDVSALDLELSSVSDCEVTVKKLLLVRNEYLAHRGSRHVTKGTFKSIPLLERDDITLLLNRALDIVRKYRERLGFAAVGWGSYEVRDFKNLLELLRAGLQASSTQNNRVLCEPEEIGNWEPHS